MLNIFLTILSNGTVDTTSSFGSVLEFANFYNFTSKADVCDKTLSSSCDSFNLVSLLIFLLEIFFNESYEQCFSCLTSNSFFHLKLSLNAATLLYWLMAHYYFLPRLLYLQHYYYLMLFHINQMCLNTFA